VPATLQAAFVFALLISPGFVLLQGYRRGRSYTTPDRDLYVLAQAIVISLGWLAAVWLLLLLVGDPVKHWGLVPRDGMLLEQHRSGIALLVLGVEFGPFALGLGAGAAVNALQGVEVARTLLGWTGLFEPPTAWEHAWKEALSRATTPGGQQAIDLSVRLKGGGVIEGSYGERSRADLSPRPSRQIFLETAYGMDDTETPPRLLGDGSIGGVFIDASEIASVYFKS
jgi:hypothetical protein